MGPSGKTLLALSVIGSLPIFAFSEVEFRKSAAAWKTHCMKVVVSSNIADYLDSDDYRALVKMGKPAIPSILKIYSDPGARGSCWWNLLLEDITGIKHANRSNFSPSVEDRFWFDWRKRRGIK